MTLIKIASLNNISELDIECFQTTTCPNDAIHSGEFFNNYVKKIVAMQGQPQLHQFPTKERDVFL